MKTYKHIILDFDGTIADSVPIFLKIYNELAAEKNYRPITPEVIPQIRYLSILKRAEFLKVPLYQIPFIIPILHKKYKQNLATLKAYEGIFETLKDLHQQGFTLDIVSSNSKENILHFLERYQFSYFDHVLCSENLMGKDSMLKRLMKMADYRLEDCLYVGDENRDIEACMKVKMDFAWVKWGYDEILSPQFRAYPVGHFNSQQELLEFICQDVV